MSGFVANGPVIAPATAPLEHDGFFPGTTLGALRERLRLPTNVTDGRLTEAAIAAMLAIDAELDAWRAQKQAAGHATLAAVDPATVCGENRLVKLYERALQSFVGAELADTHHDISATGDGKERIEQDALTAPEHRRNATHAIRDILKVPRTMVDLL